MFCADSSPTTHERGPLLTTTTAFCCHANADGDASRCACTVMPGASRDAIVIYERDALGVTPPAWFTAPDGQTL